MNRTARLTVLAAAASLLAVSAAVAQTPAQTPTKAPAKPAPYKAPRNLFGQPDLEGIWTNASITALERPANVKDLVISEDEAKRIEAQRAAGRAAGERPTNPNDPAPRKGGDVGGYNTSWTDPGTTYGRIQGQLRSSWIVEPADGRLPYTPAGKAAFDKQLAYARGTFDGPEARPLGERCMLGFGSTAGPPMLNV